MSLAGAPSFCATALQLVRGLRQPRQRLCELGAVDAGALPEFGIGAAWRRRALCCARSAGVFARRRSNTGSPKPIMRLCALLLAGEHPQRLEARDRRQHAHRMALEQPRRIAIGREVARRLDLRHGDRGLLRHQQMEWQRGERARGHHEEMPLVLDQRFDRTDQRVVKLMRKAEIEQLAPLGVGCTPCARGRDFSAACTHSFARTSPHSTRDSPRLSASAACTPPFQSAPQRIDIEPAAECGDLLARRLAPSAIVLHSKASRVSAKT